MKKKKVLFHQDNTPCHKSLVTMVKLHELGFELLPHPPHILQIWPPAVIDCSQISKRCSRERDLFPMIN